ncbi:unnamed protein product [Calypogeia fissa]
MGQRYMTNKEEKLDGLNYPWNYPIWSYCMKQILEEKHILEEKEVSQVVQGDDEVNDDDDDGSRDDNDEPDPLNCRQIRIKKRKALFLFVNSGYSNEPVYLIDRSYYFME